MDYRHFKFKIYISILIQLYRILLPCTCNVVFMWKFLDSRSPKKSGVVTRAVINFSSDIEIQTRLQESVKKSGYKTRYICLVMRITQRPLWRSCLVQTSQWAKECYVSIRTEGTSKFLIPDLGVCKSSPNFSLFLDMLKCTDAMCAHAESWCTNIKSVN